MTFYHNNRRATNTETVRDQCYNVKPIFKKKHSVRINGGR